MTEVVSLVSAKGGAGKTVLSLSLAAFLAGLGYRVVVIDADASTNGATLFLLDQVNDYAHESTERSVPLDGTFGDGLPTAMPTSYGFSLIPASYQLRDTVKGREVQDGRLRRIVHQLRDASVDYVIVDNEAGIEPYAVASADISDRVVIVSEFDPVSARGVTRIQRLYGGILPEDTTWVLFNKVLPEFAGSIADAFVAIRYLPPVAWTADVIRRYAVTELDVDMLAPTDYTLGIANLCEVLLGRESRSRVSDWRSATAEKYERALLAQRELLAERLDHERGEHWFDSSTARSGAVVILVLAIALLSWFGPPLTGIVTGAIGGIVLYLGLWDLRSNSRVDARSRDREIEDRMAEIDLLVSPNRVKRPDLDVLRRHLNEIEDQGGGELRA